MLLVQMEAASKNLKTNNMKLKGLVTQVRSVLAAFVMVCMSDTCMLQYYVM